MKKLQAKSEFVANSSDPGGLTVVEERSESLVESVSIHSLFPANKSDTDGSSESNEIPPKFPHTSNSIMSYFPPARSQRYEIIIPSPPSISHVFPPPPNGLTTTLTIPLLFPPTISEPQTDSSASSESNERPPRFSYSIPSFFPPARSPSNTSESYEVILDHSIASIFPARTDSHGYVFQEFLRSLSLQYSRSLSQTDSSENSEIIPTHTFISARRRRTIPTEIFNVLIEFVQQKSSGSPPKEFVQQKSIRSPPKEFVTSSGRPPKYKKKSMLSSFFPAKSRTESSKNDEIIQIRPRHSIPPVTAAFGKEVLESVDLIIGIDFTKSNDWTGKVSFNKRSLHAIGDTPNPYENAISIIGKTLASFDEDNLIPCYGFGDATTHDQDVFSFHSDHSPCHGIEDVLSSYRKIVPNLRLAGPTSYAPVVEAAIDIVEKSGGRYHVLLLIADSQVTRPPDLKATKRSPHEEQTINSIVNASLLTSLKLCLKTQHPQRKKQLLLWLH